MWSRLQQLLSNVLLFLPKDAGWERILEPPLLVFESSSLKREVLLLRSGSRIVNVCPTHCKAVSTIENAQKFVAANGVGIAVKINTKH